MKVGIFSNSGQASTQVSNALRSKIKAVGLKLDDDRPDIVITVGGDGTLLSAFHHYESQLDSVRFVGIHTGHLGFYTDWRDYEVDQLVDSLVHDNGQSVSYPLLDIQIDYTNGVHEQLLALNESTIKKVTGTMLANVYIKDQLFELFRGDGLCVSTPTGSTAYNKSTGGAVISSELDVVQVSEIASINNRVFRTLGSPIIISPNESVRVEPVHSKENLMTCDQKVIGNRAIRSMSFKIATQRIAFAQYRHTQFWKRVSESFIGVKPLD
ncbi:inorganic polyphosphate ATP-NAD kinase [Secundilactobacillus odoratitofui DSM 19909 = JCM 15043]|uniref:NAD kinase n=1 Tax=Secundilactobacillus odoratitofui DSM 19909 = JCM 15043 TaxID=1423776 RepID=A0A0R1LR49_9LACO|nr:NAD kinase [Secundilactobacillus odoratitofui]KRK98316.1 inorganic polyphosphate ATP-NAD kinase [Secundilactobacillus odoratitofui DSM 19909 = JCM 15043]